MASGKKSALLSSLAAYGDDSEPDSEPESEGQEAHGSLVSASYGDDDVGRAEDGEEKDSGNEESDDNEGNSEVDDSDSAEPHDESKDVLTGEKKDPNELVAQFSEKVRNMSPGEIRIPPEPPGHCSKHLQDMFDPHGWSEDSYYESLAKAQKIEMEKLEKAKKERTKVTSETL
ncbi:SAP30-binding protein-like isoform X3 [Tachysurus fulvidraco]|uniref:SAP30-binding protein-like isoform X3 n=1 Tax=Tachysurus fulvidraco TaxID=1234273 RepID=UPI001FEE4B14|nr:SAP30-binding protein-like isoform X3 [Tachysurus fulvidraco]